MPAKIGWMEMIPEAILDFLSESDAIVDRKTVERVFDVKPRQAQRILQDAGATIEGKLAVISAGDFCVYLDHISGSKLVAEENERRRRFAEKLSQMRRDHIQKGTLLVEADDTPVKNLGYDGLPAEISIGPGAARGIRLAVDAEDIQDLLGKLALLVCAMQADGTDGAFPELERRTSKQP